ncbi:MAG: hypothetical protein BGO82_07830 [Devosia sp. 67-54]|uniref:hypothetical protein n=1 Tax=unclassified Devosia TaxID=196773 RepID=UPI00095DDFE5|nr:MULTISPECIES: hypothetical protein [unclassified Devosia]MBN9307227.1 hypothetical protein [Devosia sp.]OJX19620.1 MAG: hypothetical protein BGO82_07830 [Devosia sp. 67-54]
MKRADAVALRRRLARWLATTRRAQFDSLCAGVVARTARLGGYLVVLEVGYRAHGVLIVADAATGALVFVSEWAPTGEATPIAEPATMAAIARDLGAVDVGHTVH